MASNWICIDASLVVRLLIDTADEELPKQWREWQATGRRFAAPGLLFYEVANALYQYQRHGYLSAETSREALAAAASLPIQLYHDPGLHESALRLAGKFDHGATYDAHYLALAEHLDGEFWTADRRLAKNVQGEFGSVKQWPAN